MKIKLYPLIFLLCVTSALGQTEWTKYANNPVLTKGPTNNDIIAIGQPTLLIENDTIKMWYSGVASDMKARIFLAFSLDGINWIKYNNSTPVLDVGKSGEWDSGWLDTPEIVKAPSGYFIYYYGDTTQQSPEINSSLGVAASSDGINWTKYSGNPILTKGNPADWDGKWIESPAVIYDSSASIFKMWFNGIAKDNWLIKIGYATSPDGLNWTKYANNPVMDIGANGTFDDMFLGTPAVLFRNNNYEMWYSGFSSISGYDTLRIGFATSLDGINWVKFSDNPLFGTFSPPYDSLIDNRGPWAPDVIFDSKTNSYKMWYEAEGGFLYATAPNTMTGIEELLPLDNNVTIFPNPASDYIQIPNLNKQVQIIASMSGVFIPFEMLSQSGQHINVSQLPIGVYFIRIGNKYHKFIKKK